MQIDKVDQEEDWLDEWMKSLKGSVAVDLGDQLIHTTMPMTNDYESLSKLSETEWTQIFVEHWQLIFIG